MYFGDPACLSYGEGAGSERQGGPDSDYNFVTGAGYS